MDKRTLIAARPEPEFSYIMGVPHKKWSYESVTVKFLTGMLNHKPASFDRYQRDPGRVTLDLGSLEEVPDDDLLELTASLMTYHLHRAGKLDTVSRETAVATPDPLEVRAMLTGETTAAEVR